MTTSTFSLRPASSHLGGKTEHDWLSQVTPSHLRKLSVWAVATGMDLFLDLLESGVLDQRKDDAATAHAAFKTVWNGYTNEQRGQYEYELRLVEEFGHEHRNSYDDQFESAGDWDKFVEFQRTTSVAEREYYSSLGKKTRSEIVGSHRSYDGATGPSVKGSLPSAGAEKDALETSANSIKGNSYKRKEAGQMSCFGVGCGNLPASSISHLEPATTYFTHSEANDDMEDSDRPALTEESKKRIVERFSSEAMKSMQGLYGRLDLTAIIDAQYLVTLKYSDSLADTLTNAMMARHLQALADDYEAAWGHTLLALWKKEFAPAQHGTRKGSVDRKNNMDFGNAHLHLWMAAPPSGRSAYGRRSPHRAEFGGWVWAKWLERSWQRITQQQTPRTKFTWLPSPEEVNEHWCDEPKDAINKMVAYFKKTGKGTIRKRFQNRVPANWLARGEHGTKFYGYLGLRSQQAA
ncbi:hypothetical protein QF031_000962 [Pseudarthrobacter defluvii]|uniref:hypothetical protein n=1 Tax=Pseudarthrobacter defluvii TaxID=410837 RepID=UPI002788471E|nr:hypothetical protein [Pseudarthrobacter defluvii]MDQ0768213.1 hypothetical protein [Pseudarthrobacter defluvii]